MLSQPKPVIWTRLNLKDKNMPCPLPRSGHTMTSCKGTFIVFGGTINGLKDPTIKQICSTNDIWVLGILVKGNYEWTKVQAKGDIPAPRSNHIAVSVKKVGAPNSSEILFIHGGMGDKQKYDDAFFYDPIDQKFSKINFSRENNNFPSPRANHGACLFNYKVYIFGGNGGKVYENTVFKELWEFDCEKHTWQLLGAVQQSKSIVI